MAILALCTVLLIGGGIYGLARFNVFSRLQDAISTNRTASPNAARHDDIVAGIKTMNALDTVDNVSILSDDELRDCFFSSEIDDRISERLKKMGYTDQIPLEDLRYVRVLFYDFEGKAKVGEIVVNKEIAEKTENVFYDLYTHRYPIQKMILPDAYGTRISESFSDNNTVGLCFGLGEDSRGDVHEMGYAIDLNPLYNPLIKDNGSSLSVFPMEGQLYLDRTINGDHYIYADDYAVTAFVKEGFVWKGDVAGMNDYKHFEYPHASTTRKQVSLQESENTEAENAQVEEPIVNEEPVEETPDVVEDPGYVDPGIQDPGYVDPGYDDGSNIYDPGVADPQPEEPQPEEPVIPDIPPEA